MSRQDRIEAVLRAAFAPEFLQIVDDSDKHASHAHRMTQPGHAGDGGQTHYSVAMVSAAFAGKGLLARQRAVNELLKAEFDTGLHALGLRLKAPGE